MEQSSWHLLGSPHLLLQGLDLAQTCLDDSRTELSGLLEVSQCIHLVVPDNLSPEQFVLGSLPYFLPITLSCGFLC